MESCNKVSKNGLYHQSISWRLALVIDKRARLIEELNEAWKLGAGAPYYQENDSPEHFNSVLSTAIHDSIGVELTVSEMNLLSRSYDKVCFAVVCAMSRMMYVMEYSHVCRYCGEICLGDCTCDAAKEEAAPTGRQPRNVEYIDKETGEYVNY